MSSVKVISAKTTEVEKFVKEYTRFCKEKGVSRLYLFGSWAKARHSPYSDLDFLLIVEASSEPRWKRSIEFMPSEAPVSVDVFVYTSEEAESSSFVASIVREARQLICE